MVGEKKLHALEKYNPPTPINGREIPPPPKKILLLAFWLSQKLILKVGVVGGFGMGGFFPYLRYILEQ